MSEEENKAVVQDGQPQEGAVNSEQTEVQAEAKPTAENKSFSDKVKAFTDSTKKKINGLTKKQKQIGLAIIAAILIVIIGLSVGIPLGLRSAGVVNAAGWDKAIDATIAEFEKDKLNFVMKYTITQTDLDEEGATVETSYSQEFYAVGDKYEIVIKRFSNGESYEQANYAAKENGKWYTYKYNEDLDKFEKYEDDSKDFDEEAREYVNELAMPSVLNLFKGARFLFERKDGKYQIKDIDQFRDVLDGSELGDANLDKFTISFKNGRIKEIYEEIKKGDNKTTVLLSYAFGGVKITLPTNVIVV